MGEYIIKGTMEMCSRNIISVIESRRRTWTGHLASIGERKFATKFRLEKPKEKT